jgi:hypothetical protein
MEANFDPRCEDLARLFLEDQGPDYTEEDVRSLARTIQEAIENWPREDSKS